MMGAMPVPMAKVLAGAAAIRHNWFQAAHSGRPSSQGGVKFPTGGKGDVAQARERLPPQKEGSADSV
jgi:hypothetical protein